MVLKVFVRKSRVELVVGGGPLPESNREAESSKMFDYHFAHNMEQDGWTLLAVIPIVTDSPHDNDRELWFRKS